MSLVGKEQLTKIPNNIPDFSIIKILGGGGINEV
jgi:hypothetical protein